MSTRHVDPASTAVLFVECQNGLLGEASVLRTIAEAARPCLPAMGRLAGGARGAGAQVVHLTFVPAAGNRSANRRAPLFARLLDALAGWNHEHPAVQVVPEVGVGPHDLVLPRHTGLSPTHGTETFKLLRNIGVRTIVLAGISVNVAIPVIAAEATDEDFDVIIPTDAVAGAPPEHVASMLQHTLSFMATLCTVDELLERLGAPDAIPSTSR
jgi:nicotinamidase-related amidase